MLKVRGFRSDGCSISSFYTFTFRLEARINLFLGANDVPTRVLYKKRVLSCFWKLTTVDAEVL